MALANSPDHQLTNSRFRHSGWIEVVTGSMFSGKSEELIRRLRRAQIAVQKVRSSSRSSTTASAKTISCPTDMRIPSQNVRNSDELLEHVDEDTSRGIDEGTLRRQLCRRRARRWPTACAESSWPASIRTTSAVRSSPMPQLLAIAEYITKTLAICVVCGDPANHTQRLVASSDRVLVGATGLYEARCRHCFDPHLAIAEKV
jgi:thymidine kinase